MVHTMSTSTQTISVTFQRSGKTVDWESGSLLELAENNQIDIGSGCRYGDCATCQTQLLSGAVEYLHETGVEPDEGWCLPCSCKPTTDVVLDA